MGFVNKPAPLEPEEAPTALGRHIWNVGHENPGEWRVVLEEKNRSKAVMIEGCLKGRGQGRISPIVDLTGWDARCVTVAGEGDEVLYEVRIKYSPPRAPRLTPVEPSTVNEQKPLIEPDRAAPSQAMEDLRAGKATR